MSMYNPAHPGEVLKELWLNSMGITITEAAERLGVARKTVSKLINGHGSITPEMALRIEIVFGSTAETWMNMQTVYDLWKMKDIRKHLRGTLRHVKSTNRVVASRINRAN